MLPLLRVHARRVAVGVACVALGAAGCAAQWRSARPALCAPAATAAAPNANGNGGGDALLIRKAITARTVETEGTQLHKKPFIIGVTGGTASGKTTVCEEMVRHLGGRVALIQMDRFYKTLPHSKPANTHNFDEPDAFDWPLFIETLQKLSTGQAVQVPQYSFDTHMRLPKVDTVSGADVILVEGILTLHDPRIRDQFDLKVYVEADADVRLARRIQRDMIERGRKVDGIIDQYLRTVKPAHERFIGPSDRWADIIVPWHDGPHNDLAIEILVQHINTEVYKRGLMPQEITQAAACQQQQQQQQQQKQCCQQKQQQQQLQAATAAAAAATVAAGKEKPTTITPIITRTL